MAKKKEKGSAALIIGGHFHRDLKRPSIPSPTDLAPLKLVASGYEVPIEVRYAIVRQLERIDSNLPVWARIGDD